MGIGDEEKITNSQLCVVAWRVIGYPHGAVGVRDEIEGISGEGEWLGNA